MVEFAQEICYTLGKVPQFLMQAGEKAHDIAADHVLSAGSPLRQLYQGGAGLLCVPDSHQPPDQRPGRGTARHPAGARHSPCQADAGRGVFLPAGQRAHGPAGRGRDPDPDHRPGAADPPDPGHPHHPGAARHLPIAPSVPQPAPGSAAFHRGRLPAPAGQPAGGPEDRPAGRHRF